MIFRKWGGGGVKGRLELFQKFIRFGRGMLPLWNCYNGIAASAVQDWISKCNIGANWSLLPPVQICWGHMLQVLQQIENIRNIADGTTHMSAYNHVLIWSISCLGMIKMVLTQVSSSTKGPCVLPSKHLKDQSGPRVCDFFGSEWLKVSWGPASVTFLAQGQLGLTFGPFSPILR